MIHLMIIEDEMKLQYNLAYNIPWEKYDIEMVGTAGEGEEALALIKLRKPDILLLDIEMPEMDGLSLIKELQAEDNRIHFLILSGHDDFQYVQSALTLGADNYMLKPAGNHEIVRVVTKAADQIKKGREEQYNHELLMRKWHDHLPSMQNLFLQRLVRGKLSDWEVQRDARELQLDLLLDTNIICTVAALDIDPLSAEETRFTDNDMPLLQFSLQSIVKEYMENSGCLVFTSDDGLTIILFLGSVLDNKEDLHYAVNTRLVKLLGVVKDCLKLTASSGLGQSVRLDAIPQSFQQAKKLLNKRVVYGYDIVIPYQSEESSTSSPVFNEELDKWLPFALDTGDVEQATKWIRRWHKERLEPASTMDAIVEQILFIQSVLVRTIQMQGWSVQDVVKEDFGFFRQPLLIQGKPKLVETLERIVENFIKYSEEQRSSQSNRFIGEIKKIVENSMELDLNLHTISERLYVHPSYLSRLFKKETGKTFSAYYMEQKMMRAKDLLLHETKVYETAKQVGYRDISYFTKVFRTYWGMNPSEVIHS